MAAGVSKKQYSRHGPAVGRSARWRVMLNCTIKKRPRRAFGKRPPAPTKNQKEKQAGQSPERAVESARWRARWLLIGQTSAKEAPAPLQYTPTANNSPGGTGDFGRPNKRQEASALPYGVLHAGHTGFGAIDTAGGRAPLAHHQTSPPFYFLLPASVAHTATRPSSQGPASALLKGAYPQYKKSTFSGRTFPPDS